MLVVSAHSLKLGREAGGELRAPAPAHTQRFTSGRGRAYLQASLQICWQPSCSFTNFSCSL